MRIIDISQRITESMPVYPGDPPFRSQPVCLFETGDGCEVSKLTIGTHSGTHIDAPSHMIPGGASLDDVPLDCFIGPCRVLTMLQKVITEDMLRTANIRPGERVLLRTDPTGQAIDAGTLSCAAITPEAARYLAAQKICLVGIDSPSIEDVEQYGGEVHRTLLGAGIPILEGLDLRNAREEKYVLSALPLSLPGENGSPCRAVLIEE